MPKTSLFLALPLLLASCNAPIAPSSSSSATLDPSSVSSETYTASEESSSSSDPLITLYDDKSRFYNNDYKVLDNPILKTYRHKDRGEVPYVDVAEFVRAYHIIDRDLISRSIKKNADNTYVVYYSDASSLVIDVAHQQLSFNEGFLFYGDAGKLNNNIPGDLMNGVSIVRTSNKTKVLSQGESPIIDLAKYHLEIIAQDDHLYAPFGLLNSVFITPYTTSVTYNGRDFFSAKLLTKDFNGSRARSRLGDFEWNYDGTTGASTTLMHKVTPVGEESYHFKNTDETNPSKTIDLKLKADKTIEIDTRLMNLMMLEGNWGEDESFIWIDFETLTSTKRLYIDKSDRTFFNLPSRSTHLIQYNYDILSFEFDYLYGLKTYRGISSFDAWVSEKGYKDGLLSSDPDVYDKTFARFLLKEVDDNHTLFTQSSFMGKGLLNPAGEEDASSYFGPRYDERHNAIPEYGNLQRDAIGHGYADEGITFRGKTAVIPIQRYNMQTSELGYTSYTKGEEESSWTALQRYQDQSFFRAFSVGINEVLKHSEIEHVVLDFTLNPGGYVYNFPIFAGILSKDPYIIMSNKFTNTTVEYHYEVDLNGNGIYGEDDDTFEGRYQFYILTGPASFSAGNISPAIAKTLGKAKVIGTLTGGGPCAVATRTDTSGFIYATSSQFHWPCLVNGEYLSNDEGVPLDIAIAKEDIYNFTKLNETLSAE